MPAATNNITKVVWCSGLARLFHTEKVPGSNPGTTSRFVCRGRCLAILGYDQGRLFLANLQAQDTTSSPWATPHLKHKAFIIKLLIKVSLTGLNYNSVCTNSQNVDKKRKWKAGKSRRVHRRGRDAPMSSNIPQSPDTGV